MTRDVHGGVRLCPLDPSTDRDVLSITLRMVRRVFKFLERHATDGEADDGEDALPLQLRVGARLTF